MSLPATRVGAGDRLLLPAALLVLAVALLLRLSEIGRAFWLDEALSLWFARLPWAVLWQDVPRYEPHPPFYYSLLKLLRPLGEDEVALRLPSVVCSLLVLPLAWRSLAALPDRSGRGFAGAGLLAAALLALSAPQIHFGQEVRPYAALTLAVTVLLACALRWLADLEAGAGRLGARGSTLAALAMAGAATAWLHGIAGLYVAAALIPLGCVALAHPARWRALAGLLLAAAAILILVAPLLGFLAQRGGDWGQGTWMSPLTPYRARIVAQKLLQPLPLPTDGYLGPAVLAVLLLLAGWGLLVVLGRAGWQRALLFGCCCAVPVAVTLAVSFAGTPVFAVRTLLPVAVPVLMLVAIGCWGGLPRIARGVLAAALVLAFAVGASRGFPDRRDEPFDVLAQALMAHARPGETVLVVQTDAAIPLGQYLARGGAERALRPLPAPYPALGLPNRYPYGSPALPELSEADIARVVAELAAAPVVWLVERENPAPGLRGALVALRPVEQELRFGEALRLTRFGPQRP